MTLIKLSAHESNLDRSARLIWSDGPHSAYQTRKGIVACSGDGMAIEGHFLNLGEARTALSTWTGQTARMKRGGTFGS